MNDRPLTDLQERFALEYLVDLNATRAAERAGSKAENLTVAGSEFLANPNVAARVAELQAKRAAATGIDAAWLLNRLADEAKADVNDLYDDEDNLLPVRDWPLIWRQGLVQGLEVEEIYEGKGKDRVNVGRLRKVKLDSRVKRLELIGRHIGVGAFKDVINLAGAIEVRTTIDVTGLTDEQVRVLASIPAQPK